MLKHASTRALKHACMHTRTNWYETGLICSIKVLLLHVKIMCSQVSLHLFNQIEGVCRNIRGNNTGFGGLQVIACGDFFQLPLLPDMGHGDAGEYALSSEFMQFMHHCNISTVKRQSCAHFINAIREVSTGNVSALL